jgi:Kef-type K+ transport system membrane component KefB
MTQLFALPPLANSSLNDERLLFTVLTQLILIIATARLFAVVFRCLRQPIVVGEIAAGLVLGPSCFGHFFPEASQRIFDPAAADVFGVLSQLGLILLLFIVGLEFEFSHLKSHSRAAIAVSLSGIVVPFALGAVLALGLWQAVSTPALGERASFAGFLLFLGIAMSITAIPVLGRLLLELNITKTTIGTVTMTAAAVNDAVGWILLAAISSIVEARYEVGLTVRMVAATLAFFAVVLWLVRPLLKRYIRRAIEAGNGDLTMNSLAVVYGLVFLCALATNLIGIFAVFGAFTLGTVLSDEPEFRNIMTRHLRNFLTVIFLPIFFTYTGLQTDIGALQSNTQWLMFGAVLACAIAGKLAGCGLAAYATGFHLREALCIGTLMNTRGLMELIVINVGRQLGVLPPDVYCMLVLMALFTTAMTTPLLLLLMRGTELEPQIRQSGFLERRSAEPL